MVRYGTVQNSKYTTVQYSTVRYSTVNIVHYSIVRYGMVRYSTVNMNVMMMGKSDLLTFSIKSSLTTQHSSTSIQFTKLGEQDSGPPLMTREHIEECPGFAFLRAGKDLIDVREQSEFFITVMKFRSIRA